MPKTIDYDRPKATLVDDIPIIYKLLLAELPNSPAAVAVDGTTSALISYIETKVADVWKQLFRIEATPALSIAGLTTVTIVITPIKGDGTDGTPKTYSITHAQSMDNFQAQAGFPRT